MLDMIYIFFSNVPFLCIQLVLVNPGSEVMKKLNKSKFQNHLGQRWIYLTVEEAVGACNFNLRPRTDLKKDESEGWNNV